jgi:plasmid stabilization system protein ParE
MALAFFWTKRADKKFDKIIEYLQEEWGDNVASSFVKRVYEFIDILVEFPEIGKIENKERDIRGFVILKQITLFYKVNTKGIIILNLFDNRQSPTKCKH